jgi:sulfonate transport system permease protein
VRRLLLALLVPAALGVLWWATAALGWLPDQLLPAPGLVWNTLVETAESGELYTLISFERVGTGFAVGALAGVAFGGAIGLSRTLRALFDPLFLFLAQVPPLAWIPLVILAVGIDEAMKVTVIAWASFVPVVLGVAQGIRDVPDGFRELARALTFDPWSLVSRVILPAAVPAIFTGLREGLANAWQTMVAAELFASSEGLGYLISLGRQLFQLDLVLAMVVVLGFAGLAVNGALAVVERQLLRWQAHAS